MRRRIGIGLATVALVAGCGDAGDVGTAAPRGVEAAIESLFAGVRSGDAETVLAAYDRGEGFVYVGCTSARLGIEAMERMTRMHYARPQERPATYELLNVRPVGDAAVVVTARGRVADSGTLHWTWVLEREGDEWAIVHEHESWPDCAAPSTHPTVEPPAG